VLVTARTWTPVGAGLPDHQNLVDIALEDGDVAVGFFERGAWRWADGMPIAARVLYWMRKPASPVGAPMLRLGQIRERLGFDVTEAFLNQLGFAVIAHDRAARLYPACDFPMMCAAIIRHVMAAQAGRAEQVSP
jgi:hypothetical protein